MKADDFVMWAMGIGLIVFMFVMSLFFVGLMAGWWTELPR